MREISTSGNVYINIHEASDEHEVNVSMNLHISRITTVGQCVNLKLHISKTLTKS